MLSVSTKICQNYYILLPHESSFFHFSLPDHDIKNISSPSFTATLPHLDNNIETIMIIIRREIICEEITTVLKMIIQNLTHFENHYERIFLFITQLGLFFVCVNNFFTSSSSVTEADNVLVVVVVVV